VSCAKTAEMIEMPFDEGQDRKNPLAAAKGDKSTMRPFAKLLWTVLAILHSSWLYVYTVLHYKRPFSMCVFCKENNYFKNLIIGSLIAHFLVGCVPQW